MILTISCEQLIRIELWAGELQLAMQFKIIFRFWKEKSELTWELASDGILARA